MLALRGWCRSTEGGGSGAPCAAHGVVFRLQQVVLHAALVLRAAAGHEVLVQQLELLGVCHLSTDVCKTVRERTVVPGWQLRQRGLRTSLNSTQTRTGPWASGETFCGHSGRGLRVKYTRPAPTRAPMPSHAWSRLVCGTGQKPIAAVPAVVRPRPCALASKQPVPRRGHSAAAGAAAVARLHRVPTTNGYIYHTKYGCIIVICCQDDYTIPYVQNTAVFM